MARRKVPEFNAAPMADIAFLLLIFFLVTTTMDTDKGILRKLPPYEEDTQKDEPEIKERNVFVVLLNKNNDLLVEGEPARIGGLTDRVKEFIRNPNNKQNLSAKKTEEIPHFGKTQVSKGVVSLQNDRGTEYGEYIKVQNELTKAFNELRNEAAMDEFGKEFSELAEDKKEAIKDLYPLSISEAEPRSVGG